MINVDRKMNADGRSRRRRSPGEPGHAPGGEVGEPTKPVMTRRGCWLLAGSLERTSHRGVQDGVAHARRFALLAEESFLGVGTSPVR